MRLKRCFKCGEVKGISEFYKHPMMGDGHLGKCKTCTKRDSRETYHRKRDDPVWVEKERRRAVEKMVRRGAAYRARYPERWRARQILSNAVQRGTIVKPNRCERCDAKLPHRQLHGHHEDYGKPLEVQWLCAQCHSAVHNGASF